MTAPPKKRTNHERPITAGKYVCLPAKTESTAAIIEQAKPTLRKQAKGTSSICLQCSTIKSCMFCKGRNRIDDADDCWHVLPTHDV